LLSSGEFAIYQAETLLLEVCQPKYGNLKNKNNYARFISDWIRSKQFYRSALDPIEFVEGAINHHDNYIEFMKYFMESVTSKQGKKRWAENTPSHIFYMKELMEYFPEAKFIHVIRDGRDVAVSKRKLGWTGTKNNDPLKQLVYAAKGWERSVKAGRCYGKELGNNYMEIRYEDIVTNLDATLADISRFADITIDRSKIENSSIGSLGKANTAFSDKLPGISSRAVGRWKSELGDEEINILHLAIGDSLTQLGYDVSDDKKLRVSWKNGLHLKMCPTLLKMRAFLKYRTFLGRFTSDAIEIGLQ